MAMTLGAIFDLVMGASLPISMDGTPPSESPVVSLSIPVQGRLSLTQGVSVPESDVVATTLYLVPTDIDLFPVFDGTAWQARPFSELTLALDATAHLAGKAFDAFVAWQAGSLIIGTGPAWDTVAWGASSQGTGAGTTETELFKGRWVNKHPITLRNGATVYDTIPARQATVVGGCYTIADGQTADTLSQRYVWSVNAVPRLARGPAENTVDPVTSEITWLYSLASYRQARANAANQFSYFQGLGGRPVNGLASSFVANSTSTKRVVSVGIGVNSTTINSATDGGLAKVDDAGGSISARYSGFPPIGLNKIVWLENGGGGDVQKWFGVQPKFAVGVSGEVFL